VTGHVTGREAGIRAREQGVTDLASSLLFYPQSLLADHVGEVMGAGLILAPVIGLFGWFGRSRSGAAGARFDAIGAAVFVAIALLVPLTALTSDVARSPVVANVMVPSLLWGALLLLVTLPGLHHRLPIPRVFAAVLAVVATGILAAGLCFQFYEFSRTAFASENHDDIDRLLAIYDQLGDRATEMGWTFPNMAFNVTQDSFNHRVFEVSQFERKGKWFDAREALAGTIFSRSMQEMQKRMTWADLAVITEVPSAPPAGFEHEFDRAMRQATPALLAWCQQNMLPLQTTSIFGRTVHVFMRPAVRFHADSDGWVSAKGAYLMTVAQSLRLKPVIELSGANSAPYIPQPPVVHAALTLADGTTMDLPAQVTYEGARYHLRVQADPAKLAAAGKIRIDLAFDSSFTPRKINGTADDRDLVFMMPDEGRLRAAD
jgi:hypothetical protein